jgi:uncharacterized protein
MDRNQNILRQVKQRIQSVDPNAKIFLFGSRARDDYRVDSDWDFLILTEKQITQDLKNKISDLLFETELDTDQVLTSIVQNVTTWKNYSNTPIYSNIIKDSIEL